MLTYTCTEAPPSTSYSYSREGWFSTTSSAHESFTFSDGQFFTNNHAQTDQGSTLSIEADESETRQTLSQTFRITGSATHSLIAGATTDLSSFSNILEWTSVLFSTIGYTRTASSSSYSELGSGVTDGTSTSSSSTSQSESSLFTVASTVTYQQTTTTAITSTATYRTTSTTATTRMSTSIDGGNTVIYYPSTTAYTTTIHTQTVTQQSRWQSTIAILTSTREAFLKQTIAICEAAFYTFTTAIGGVTFTLTKGNEILIIPTTTAPGLAAWADLGTTAESSRLGSFSVYEPVYDSFSTFSSSSTATGASGAHTSKTYFYISHSYTFNTILPTSATDTVTYHATRFKSTTSTSTLTETSSSTQFNNSTGTSTHASSSTTYTVSSFSVTATVTYTDTTTNVTSSLSTFTLSAFTSSFDASDNPITYSSSYTSAVGVTDSTATATYTSTSEAGNSVTETITSTAGSYSYSFSDTGSVLITGTFTTTQTSTYLTGSTTSTSAKSNDYLPFETGSTTTSLTGFIEIYTKTAVSEKVTTTGGTFSASSITGITQNITTGERTFTVHTTIDTTIQIPWSYHNESTTTQVTTTVLTVLTLRTTRNGGALIDGDEPSLARGNETVWTLPDRSFSEVHNQSYTTHAGTDGQTFVNNASMVSSTHEEFTGNGFVVRADLSLKAIFAAAAGNPFQVHPCMAIGFRPATNDVLSAPIYFHPTFGVGTFSISAWDKFTTTTASGTGTVSTTDSSVNAVIQTLSTIPFSHISLHQGTSASLFVSNPFTESRSEIRSYSSSWGSWHTFTLTTTRTTSTTTDATTANTSSSTFNTFAGPFYVTETTISLFSGNTIFITRSAPAVFQTSGKLYSQDERDAVSTIATTQTESVLIAFGASIADSTHLRNEFSNDPGGPMVYGGWHPVTSQTGYAVMTIDNNTTFTTVPVLIVGAAWKMTVSPRSGGATTTTTASLTMYSISENHTFGKFEIYLTNSLSLIHALEPITLFSLIEPVTTISIFTLGIEGMPFVTTTTRYAFLDRDSTTS
jgi:hypothetical protein